MAIHQQPIMPIHLYNIDPGSAWFTQLSSELVPSQKNLPVAKANKYQFEGMWTCMQRASNYAWQVQ